MGDFVILSLQEEKAAKNMISREPDEKLPGPLLFVWVALHLSCNLYLMKH